MGVIRTVKTIFEQVPHGCFASPDVLAVVYGLFFADKVIHPAVKRTVLGRFCAAMIAMTVGAVASGPAPWRGDLLVRQTHLLLPGGGAR